MEVRQKLLQRTWRRQKRLTPSLSNKDVTLASVQIEELAPVSANLKETDREVIRAALEQGDSQWDGTSAHHARPLLLAVAIAHARNAPHPSPTRASRVASLPTASTRSSPPS